MVVSYDRRDELMKKKLSIALVCILSLGMVIPTFAIETGNAKDIEWIKTKSISEELLEDVLQNYPDAETQVSALFEQAEAYDFSSEQIEMHLQGMKEYAEAPAEVQYGTLSEDGSMYILPNGDTVPNRFYGLLNVKSEDGFTAERENEHLRSFTSNYLNIVDANDQSGVFWVVQSTTGHNQATAYLNLPSVSAASNSPDRPYMFFGANTTSSSICGDYGLVYYPATQSWALFTNALKWNSSTGSYDSMPWQQIPLPSSYTGGSSLYLHILVTNTSGADTVTITVKDGSNFSVLGTLSYSFTGNPFNNSLSNLNLYREITLSQFLGSSGILNTSTGTLALNYKFNNAYLYSPSNYYSWGTAQTTTAYRKAPTNAKLSTVTVNSYTKWNSENISIKFNQ